MVTRLAFMVFFLFALAGCNAVTTVTAYRHNEKGWDEFATDQARCKAFADEYVPRPEWWRFGADLLGLDHAGAQGMHLCLTRHGWQPTVQLVGPLTGTLNSLDGAIRECAAGTSLAGAVDASYLSGESLTNLSRLIRASDDTAGRDTPQFTGCLAERGWWFVYSPPWIAPDSARVASALVLPPVYESLAEKFVAKPGVPTVRDNGTAVSWPKDAGRFATPLNWEQAKGLLGQLNREGFAGRNDWRLPSLEELRSLINFSAWNIAAPERNLASIGIDGIASGIYWTASKAPEGGIYGVDISNGRLLRLDKEPLYTGRVLPVAGGGWNPSRGNLAALDDGLFGHCTPTTDCQEVRVYAFPPESTGAKPLKR